MILNLYPPAPAPAGDGQHRRPRGHPAALRGGDRSILGVRATAADGWRWMGTGDPWAEGVGFGRTRFGPDVPPGAWDGSAGDAAAGAATTQHGPSAAIRAVETTDSTGRPNSRAASTHRIGGGGRQCTALVILPSLERPATWSPRTPSRRLGSQDPVPTAIRPYTPLDNGAFE